LTKTDRFNILLEFYPLLAVAACLFTCLLTALTTNDVANRLVGVACNGLAYIANEAKTVIHNAARALEGGTADVTTRLDEVLDWGIYAAEKTS